MVLLVKLIGNLAKLGIKLYSQDYSTEPEGLEQLRKRFEMILNYSGFTFSTKINSAQAILFLSLGKLEHISNLIQWFKNLSPDEKFLLPESLIHNLQFCSVIK